MSMEETSDDLRIRSDVQEIFHTLCRAVGNTESFPGMYGGVDDLLKLSRFRGIFP